MSYAPLLRKPELGARTGSLRIGEPNDAFEKEADQAEEIMFGDRLQWSLSPISGGAPLQRECACSGFSECEECKEKNLQRKGDDGAAKTGYAPPIVDEVLRSPGRPLDAPTRAFFEPRFGYDLSRVRIHTDAEAAQSARSVGAKAYTVGNHVAFASGRFTPITSGGGALLAHELAHVVQQNGAAAALQRDPDDDDDDEPETSMHLPSPGERARPAQRAKPRKLPEDRYGPGGSFRYEALYESADESEKRIDRQIAKDREISKRPYKERLEQAHFLINDLHRDAVPHDDAWKDRDNHPITAQSPEEVWQYGIAHDLFLRSEEQAVREDVNAYQRRTYDERFRVAGRKAQLANSTLQGSPQQVWENGTSYGLFLESEKALVLGDQQAFLNELREKSKKLAAAHARQEEYERDRAQQALFDEITSPQMVIQPFAFAAMGPLIGAAYGGAQTGILGGTAVNACSTGSTADCVSATAQLGLDVAMHRMAPGTTGARDEPSPAFSGPDSNAKPVLTGPDPNPIPGQGQATPRTVTLRSVSESGEMGPPRGHPSNVPAPPGGGAAAALPRGGQAANENVAQQSLPKTGTTGAGDVVASGGSKTGGAPKTKNPGKPASPAQTIRGSPPPPPPTATADQPTTLTRPADKPVAADASKDAPMRRPRGGGDRPGMTATEKTLEPHKRPTPVVEVLPRSTVPMKDFEPPEPGHYIRRKPPSAETQHKILERAGRTSDGRLRDANTGRALEDGEAVWGHAPNYQFKEMRDMAEKLGWTQQEFDEFYEDPAKWQIEYGPSNSGRVFDRIPRGRPVH